MATGGVFFIGSKAIIGSHHFMAALRGPESNRSELPSRLCCLPVPAPGQAPSPLSASVSSFTESQQLPQWFARQMGECAQRST